MSFLVCLLWYVFSMYLLSLLYRHRVASAFALQMQFKCLIRNPVH
jgi:hypothetical protein